MILIHRDISDDLNKFLTEHPPNMVDLSVSYLSRLRRISAGITPEFPEPNESASRLLDHESVHEQISSRFALVDINQAISTAASKDFMKKAAILSLSAQLRVIAGQKARLLSELEECVLDNLKAISLSGEFE